MPAGVQRPRDSQGLQKQERERPAPASKGPQTSVSALASVTPQACKNGGSNCGFRRVFWRGGEQSFFDFYSVALQLQGFWEGVGGKPRPRPGLRTACCKGNMGMGNRASTWGQAASHFLELEPFSRSTLAKWTLRNTERVTQGTYKENPKLKDFTIEQVPPLLPGDPCARSARTWPCSSGAAKWFHGLRCCFRTMYIR